MKLQKSKFDEQSSRNSKGETQSIGLINVFMNGMKSIVNCIIKLLNV
jgi:hypothetical protein